MAEAEYLQRAYELAREHRPHPNPRVGAVVVSSSNEVIGEGAHQAAGQPHAERQALTDVDARGSTLYVSLEPCAHHGRTPPCTDLIVESGVSRVVVGAIDPDPRVSGAGIERLEQAGVVVDVLEDAGAHELDPGYFHHRRTGLAMVTLKFAMTVDGAAAAADGSSQWISGEAARADAHSLRANSDAVVVGSGTLIADDPGLDVRIPDYNGDQPRPVIVAGSRALPGERKIWKRGPLVFTPNEVKVPSGDSIKIEGDGPPDPKLVCRAMADLGLYDVLLEGGPTLAGAWWRAGVVSRLSVYVSGRLGGGVGMSPLGGVFATIGDAVALSLVKTTQLGNDVRVDYLKD